MDIADVTYAMMADRIGDVFALHMDDGRVLAFELSEVTALASGADESTGFSALFRGPLEPALNQSTLPLRHEEWGTVHLFVVPVGQDESATIYEAIVSRSSN